MPYSFTEIKADAEAALHGTSINKVRNFNGVANRAARRCLADCDFAETKRVVPLSSPFFSSIYDYPAPTDLKNDRLIDVRTQTNRTFKDGFSQTYAKEFDQSKSLQTSGVKAEVKWDDAVKTLRIAIPQQSALALTTCEATTGWTAGGTASNILLDTQNFFEGNASLRFDITTGVGYLENSTLSATDLTTVKSIGSLFNSVYLPASGLTSVNLRWGSDSANYYTATATADHAGNAYQLGWNVSEFPWTATTTVGTPVVTSITYLRVTLTVSANMTVRMDSVTAQLGKIYEAEYYSKYLFRDGITGAFKEKVTADSDLLNLDTDSYEVYTSCLFWMISQQLQGLDAVMADGGYNEAAYQTNLARYIATHRSEVSLPVIPYYRIKKGGYAGIIGTRLS